MANWMIQGRVVAHAMFNVEANTIEEAMHFIEIGAVDVTTVIMSTKNEPNRKDAGVSYDGEEHAAYNVVMFPVKDEVTE